MPIRSVAENCVGREIPWPGQEEEAVDQEWFSALDQRVWRFSDFAYAFVSFDLVLSLWIDPDYHLNFEATRVHIAKALALLNECETAALRDVNEPVLEMIAKGRRFFTLWSEATRLRMTQEFAAPHAS